MSSLTEGNPLLKIRYRIPFDEIRAEHVEPAIQKLLAAARERLEAIAAQPGERTWENTMAALDLMTEPLGKGKDGRDVWIGDVWPTSDEVHALLKSALDPVAFEANYAKVKSDPGDLWKEVGSVAGQVYT